MTARPDDEHSGQRAIVRRDHIAGGAFIVAGLLVFGQFDGVLDLYRFQIEGLAAGNHVLEEAVGKYGLPVFA